MSIIYLQKIMKSRKLLENHVILGPQSFIWPKIGRSPPVNKKGKNKDKNWYLFHILIYI